MKKKLFAAIAAGAMLCGMLTAPVSAAETYQKGDVNMDGIVNVKDVQLALEDYVEVITGNKGILTEEQRNLGNVNGETQISTIRVSQKEYELVVDLQDAQLLLFYYTEHLTDESVTLDMILDKYLK